MASRKVEIILTAVDKTKKAFVSASQSLKSFSSKFAGVAASIGAVFGVASVASVTAMGAALKETLDELDELGKTSRSLNTTVEALSSLQFAIGQTSTLTDAQFNTVLQRMVRRIGAAKNGASELAKVFEDLGLDIDALSEQRSDEAFLSIAAALGKIENAYARAAPAQKIFDDGWRGVIQAVDAGPAKLAELAEQYSQMGGPTTEAAEAAEAFNDQLDVLGKQIDALKYKAAPSAITFLTNLLGDAGFSAKSTVQGVRSEIDRLEEQLARLTDGRSPATEFWSNLFGAEGAVEERVGELKSEISSLYEQLNSLEKTRETSAQSHAAAIGTIHDRLTAYVGEDLSNRVKTYEEYVKDLKTISQEEESLLKQIKQAGTNIGEGADAVQRGSELDAGDLFLAYKEGLASLQSGDVDSARQTIVNITEAMNSLAESGTPVAHVLPQIRQLLTELAKDIAEFQTTELIDSTKTAEEVKKANAALQDKLRANVGLDIHPDSVEQIKAAVTAAMQGFSVPVQISPVVASGVGIQQVGESGEASFSDASAAAGHKTQ